MASLASFHLPLLIIRHLASCVHTLLRSIVIVGRHDVVLRRQPRKSLKNKEAHNVTKSRSLFTRIVFLVFRNEIMTNRRSKEVEEFSSNDKFNKTHNVEHVEDLEVILDVNRKNKNDITTQLSKIVHSISSIQDSFSNAKTERDGLRAIATRLWNICIKRSQQVSSNDESQEIKKSMAERRCSIHVLTF